MKKFKIAIPLFIYQMYGYDPYSDEVLASIAEAGYDAVEVPGATRQIKKPEKLKEKIARHGLKVAAVTGLWGWAGGELGAVAEKDIMSSNPKWRKNAVTYIKQCERNAEPGCPLWIRNARWIPVPGIQDG